MTDWNQYWQENTFDLNRRVNVIRDLLKVGVANTAYDRFGTPNDGGYVLAQEWWDGKSTALLSMGVERNVDFEVDMSKYMLTTHMYDYSVDGPPKEVPNSTFFKEKIGLGLGEVSLDAAVHRMPEDVNLILKMDIEGSEWGVLGESTMLDEFSQITVEMHWLFNITDDAFYAKVVKALANLRATHLPVLVHANNDQPLAVMGACPVPNVFEVLYLNKGYFNVEEPEDQFAGLVVVNNPTFPEIGLSFP